MSLYKTHYVVISYNTERTILSIRWKYNPSNIQMKLGYTRIQQILKRNKVHAIVDDQLGLQTGDYEPLQRWFLDHYYPEIQDRFIQYQIILSPYLNYTLLQKKSLSKFQIALAVPEENML